MAFQRSIRGWNWGRTGSSPSQSSVPSPRCRPAPSPVLDLCFGPNAASISPLVREPETGLANFEAYGLRFAVGGDWPEVVEDVRLDFAWFERPAPPGRPVLDIKVVRGAPDLDGFGSVPAAFVTTRNVVYQEGERTIVDFFGRAVAVFDRRRNSLLVQGEERHLVHEAVYLFLLSRIGEHLDRRRLMRVHALGLSGPNGAVVVMLPSGGGKSTLALRALKEPGVKLLSEDTPVLDRRGVVHPFPLRVGVNPTDAASLPAGEVRRIERMEFHPKLVLSIDAFADQIEIHPKALRHLVVGERSLGRDAYLEPVPRRALVGPLLREGVVGVGVAQMIEYVLQRGASDFLKQGSVATRRAWCCGAALARARGWRLRLGRDQERNWAALAQLLG